jgi:hypothetical protein
MTVKPKEVKRRLRSNNRNQLTLDRIGSNILQANSPSPRHQPFLEVSPTFVSKLDIGDKLRPRIPIFNAQSTERQPLESLLSADLSLFSLQPNQPSERMERKSISSLIPAVQMMTSESRDTAESGLHHKLNSEQIEIRSKNFSKLAGKVSALDDLL